MNDLQSQSNGNEGALIIQVATAKKQGQNAFGIGATVRNEANTKIADWMLKERSLGSNILDDALALNLVLCKVIQQQWRKVQLNFCNKEL